MKKKKQNTAQSELLVVGCLGVLLWLFLTNEPLERIAKTVWFIGVAGEWLARVAVSIATGVAVGWTSLMFWRNKELKILKGAMAIFAVPFFIWLLYGWAAIPSLMAQKDIPFKAAYLVMHFSFFAGYMVFVSTRSEPSEDEEQDAL